MEKKVSSDMESANHKGVFLFTITLPDPVIDITIFIEPSYHQPPAMDQQLAFEGATGYTAESIQRCLQLSQFIKKRIAIEEEYARALSIHADQSPFIWCREALQVSIADATSGTAQE